MLYNAVMTSSLWTSEFPDGFASLPGAVAGLLRASSLTAALRALGAEFSVRLLHLGEVALPADEADSLTLAARKGKAPSCVFGREVVLCLDNTPVVWARSVCAPEAMGWRGILDCGTRPLGERLFDGSLKLTRTPFEFAQVSPQPGRAADFAPLETALPARRSRFELNHESLWLTECFLPTLAQFCPADTVL